MGLIDFFQPIVRLNLLVCLVCIFLAAYTDSLWPSRFLAIYVGFLTCLNRKIEAAQNVSRVRNDLIATYLLIGLCVLVCFYGSVMPVVLFSILCFTHLCCMRDPCVPLFLASFVRTWINWIHFFLTPLFLLTSHLLYDPPLLISGAMALYYLFDLFRGCIFMSVENPESFIWAAVKNKQGGGGASQKETEKQKQKEKEDMIIRFQKDLQQQIKEEEEEEEKKEKEKEEKEKKEKKNKKQQKKNE